MNKIINTNKGIGDGTDMLFDGDNLSDDFDNLVLLNGLTVYENTEWKEVKVITYIEKIPKDWNLVKLKDIFDISRGSSPRPIQNFLSNKKEDINWIKIGDISEGSKYVLKTKQKISKDVIKQLRLVKDGDFILSNSMSFGRPYIVKIKGAIHDGWLLLKEKNNLIYKNFYYLQLSSEFVKKQLIRKAVGSTVDNLTKELVNETNTVLFSVKEQLSLYKLLTKQEDIIENINKSIDKTRKIIKYYHQELLSGRLRLKEVETINGKEIVVYENTEWKEEKVNGRIEVIPEDWCKVLFSDFFVSRMGETILDKDLILNGKFPVYSATERDKFFGYVNKKSINLEKNDIVIPARGNSIGFLKIVKEDFTCTQTTIASKLLNKEINGLTKFVYEFLLYLKRNKILFKIEGGAIPQLTVKEVNKFELLMPVTNEITLIRDFLTKLDDNLELLLKTKEKEEKTFKFLQQEFLSGKLRLK